MAAKIPLYQPYRYTAGDPPELPVRATNDAGAPDYILRARLLSHDSNKVVLTGEMTRRHKATITASLIAPGVARILMETELSDPKRVRLAREPNWCPAVSIESTEHQVCLHSEFLHVQIDLDPFHIAFLGPGGSPLLHQNNTRRDLTGRFMTLPLGFSEVDGKRVACHDSFDVEPDEHFYGGGEKFTNFDKRGQRLEMWNYDCCTVLTERAYKNIPFFVSTKGYGIFVDSITATNLDFAASSTATLSLIVPDTALDYYVIAGPDPKTIIQGYSMLVGFPTPLPKWALGLWLSSGWLKDDEELVRERASLMRQNHIPCDVMHLDSYWQRHGCWSDLIWDSKAFPDPAKLLNEIKSLGYRICVWIDPRIGILSERFLEGRQQGYFLKSRNGDTQIVDSWDGFHPPVASLDFTNPEAVTWFQSKIRDLLQIGVDAIKTDNGEKVPIDAVANNGMAGQELHNYYALLYNDAVAEIIAQETKRTPVLWGRSSFAGGQRHSAQWGGDAASTYQDMASTLRGGLSLAMCGHAFWSHDIGGFNGNPSTDLYIRWAQFGLFSPLSRLHGTSSRLPWDYGDEALRIFRDYVRLRYRLIPYIYTYAKIAAEAGLPILRPMWLEFPDDPNTYTLDLQYMFGAEILVAPIYNQSGRRPVYLPSGKWVNFWSHDVLEGPQTYWVDAPLDQLPIFVRGNSLIPTVEPLEHLTDDPFQFITLEAYLLDQGGFIVRDCDGDVRLAASFNGTELLIQREGIDKKLGFRLLPLPGNPVVERVLVNGVELRPIEKAELIPSGKPGWERLTEGTIQLLLP